VQAAANLQGDRKGPNPTSAPLPPLQWQREVPVAARHCKGGGGGWCGVGTLAVALEEFTRQAWQIVLYQSSHNSFPLHYFFSLTSTVSCFLPVLYEVGVWVSPIMAIWQPFFSHW